MAIKMLDCFAAGFAYVFYGNICSSIAYLCAVHTQIYTIDIDIYDMPDKTKTKRARRLCLGVFKFVLFEF